MNNIISDTKKVQFIRKIMNLVFILLIVFGVSVITVPKAQLFFIERKLDQRIETQHFLILFSAQDIENANSLQNTLESSLVKITNDLDYTLPDKITVKIYPTLKEFHVAAGRPDAPDWFRGYADDGKINIVSPSKMGDISPGNVIIHELTHIITRRINTDIPLWIYEGIASYEGREMDLDYIKKSISKDISEGKIPTFEELCTEYKTFGENKGYQFSFTAVEFIISQYGFEKINSIIRSSNDFTKVLGITESKLHEEWVQYLKQNYL